MDNENLSLSNTHFIDVEISVNYVVEPLLKKKPRCPDAFTWDGHVFHVSAQIMEWVDNTRRGRMARNMSDAHSIAASRKGSWGVGRFYFRVITTDRRIFDIYYDRAPKGSAERKGQWFLFREFTGPGETLKEN